MENNMLKLPAKNAAGINGTMRAHHVGLRTTDMDGTIGWYTEKLGFRVISRREAGSLQLAFLAPANDDHFWLEVLSGGDTSPAPDTALPVASGFQHLCFSVDNADEVLAALRARGVRVTREPFDVPAIGKRCGFVADLYGNTLEFMQDIG